MLAITILLNQLRIWVILHMTDNNVPLKPDAIIYYSILQAHYKSLTVKPIDGLAVCATVSARMGSLYLIENTSAPFTNP